jgi:uncharacterized protein (TIGR02596 family)
MKLRKTPPSLPSASAFSLVDLLLVIVLISGLMVLLAPAFNGISGGNKVTEATNQVAAELGDARQISLAKTRPIEIRFYKVPGETTNSEEVYRAFRMVESDTGTALDKVYRLPRGVILTDDPKYSTILSNLNLHSGSETVPGLGSGKVDYVAVRFKANGETSLDPLGAGSGATRDEWFLSVIRENAKPGTDRPADNFGTIHIDPLTGRTRIYRP